MKIVITGASGLIGSALLEPLRRGGHEVIRLVWHPSGDPDAFVWDPAAGTIDMEALREVEGVVHLAGTLAEALARLRHVLG